MAGKPKIKRRDFLRSGAALTASVSAPHMDAGAAIGAFDSPNSNAIPTRKFGRTGLTMPVLGHGGAAMIARDHAYYGIELLSMDARIAMVRNAYEQGVRYFDTARVYGESESIIGEALKDVRKHAYIATKVLVFKPEHVRQSIEDSLKALQSDYVDCIQIQGPVIERMKFDGVMPLLAEIIKLCDEKVCRFAGLTGHSAFEDMHKLIDTGEFDSLLIDCGYFRSGLNTRHSSGTLAWRERCMDRATELHMGVVGMKVFGARVFGHNAKNVVDSYDSEALKRLPGAAIRWVLQDSRVHVLNIGMSQPSDLDDNLSIVKGAHRCSESDRMLLADFSEKAYQHPHFQGMPLV
jgi:predicted aldo/keto reductase-like oxidoreductase